MNKLLKVTLITAIMATSGMCGDRCQHTTFDYDSGDYNLGHTASHGSTWITEFLNDETPFSYSNNWTSITGEVKIRDHSRWINKGRISLEGQHNIIDHSEVINDGGIAACNEGKLAITGESFILLKGIGAINSNGAEREASITVEDKSIIRLSDSAFISAFNNGTITINEGCIVDARDSKDLSNWYIADNGAPNYNGTFNMEAGSIMYLPKEVASNVSRFTITLKGTEDKPVELRYIQHTDITFDGLRPNVTHSGCNYKLSDWEKGTTNITDPTTDEVTATVPYIQEPYTDIKFTWEGINKDTTMTIPPSIAKLVPIYTWSVSTKCNGEDVKILESRDLQCCDELLKYIGL